MKQEVRKKSINRLVPYFFVLPGMLLFFLIVIIPIAQTLILSLSDWDGVRPLTDIGFIGLENYKEILTADEFRIALKNNIIWAVVSVTVPIAIGLVQAAVIVNSKVKCKNLFQLLLFLPQILSSMIMSVMWLAIYDPASGLLNSLLQLAGLKNLILPWLGNKNTAIWALLVMSVWSSFGFNTIIYCTAIRAVNPALYEAATLDGANDLQLFFKITIPTIRNTTNTLVLLSLIGAFKVFDVVFQMTKGGPGYYTYVISYYLYHSAFTSNKVGFGCAIAVLLTIIVLAVSRAFQWFTREA